MFELIQAAENSYYIECPAKIGIVIIGEKDAAIIDSGNDRSAGKKIKRILDENGWNLKEILNTHSHADHIGGNQYLQTQTGCDIYASGIECDFTRHPILEPSYLFGGNPPAQLRHKFLLAEPSDAKPLFDNVLPDSIKAIPLPGHSFDMIGFKTSDNIIYLGDCLSSEETLKKYKIGFIADVGAYLNTLEEVCKLDANLFIPSHAAATEDIIPLARININTVLEIGEVIIEHLKTPKCFDELLGLLFDTFSLNMSFEQYALVGSSVKSYLTWLMNDNRIAADIYNNRLIWKRL